METSRFFFTFLNEVPKNGITVLKREIGVSSFASFAHQIEPCQIKGKRTVTLVHFTDFFLKAPVIPFQGRDEYIASLTIESLDRRDLDVFNNHQLEVTNDAGTTVFDITILTRNCDGEEEDQDSSRGGGSSGEVCDFSNRLCR